MAGLRLLFAGLEFRAARRLVRSSSSDRLMQWSIENRIQTGGCDNAAQSSALTVFVTAELDPAALLRVLEPFRSINVIPRRTLAEIEPPALLRIRLEFTDLTARRLALIATRIQNAPCILDVTWCRSELESTLLARCTTLAV